MSGVTLVEFLTARLDEDEASARAAMGGSSGAWASWNHRAHAEGLRDLACDGVRLAELPMDADEHIARHDPARVLREVEAKRAIVRDWQQAGDVAGLEWESERSEEAWAFEAKQETLEVALRHLAAVYSDHPDYDEAWRP